MKAQCRRVSFARVGAAALSLGWQVVAVGDFLEVHDRSFQPWKIPGAFLLFHTCFHLGFSCPLAEYDGNEKAQS